jgi:glycerol uptake facilitator-like aquaporin
MYVARNTGIGHAFGLELITTYLFILPAFATAFGKHVWGNKAWITVGIAVYLGIFVAAPFSGASLNPAVHYRTQHFLNSHYFFFDFIV